MPAERDWETTGYLYALSAQNSDRLRVRLRVELSNVVQFSVQYETFVEHHWRPIVRYDSARGYAHRDLLDLDGRNIEQLYLGTIELYAEIVTNGINDIKVNWPIYRENFLSRSA